jgi:hypothetical protein
MKEPFYEKLFANEVIVHMNKWSDRFYLFSKSVQESSLSVGKEIPAEILKNIPIKSATFLLDKNTAYHFYKKEDCLAVIYITQSKGYYNWDCFSVLFEGQFLFDPYSDRRKDFLKLLLFLCFADKKLMPLLPSQKERKNNTTYYNRLPHNVTVVNRSWNRIYTEKEVNVKPHYRLQRVGKGRKDIKMIEVKGHKRVYHKKQ